MIKLHAPQIIMLCFVLLSLLQEAHYHGKPRSNHNFWMNLINLLLAQSLLFWGGFYS
jgi:hypothetical protein